jgi:septal ring factor EnvC (AmiA/AmiB activator)
MPVFDENGKQITTDEEFPNMKDPEEAGAGSEKPARKSFPILPAALALIALIFAVAAGFYMFKANGLEQEVEILKKTKAQLASTEAKLTDMAKENNKVRAELSQAKNELDAAKAKSQALEEQLAKKKAAAAAPKKDAKAAPKKTPPKRP